MTNYERKEAFELRLDGYTWEEIGKFLGYSASTVCEDIHHCVQIPRRSTPCVYPRVAAAIAARYGNVSRLAKDCGLPYGAVYRCLIGRNSPKRDGIGERICSAIGLTMEEAFVTEDAL